MAWVAEIQKHVDYFKDQYTTTVTLLAATREDAEKLAALYVMDRLDDQDFRPFTPDGEDWFDGVTEEMKKAILSRDPNKIFKVLSENQDEIFKGEYVSPTLEIEVYGRSDDYDKFDEDRFRKLCDSARDWIDQEGDLVPYVEGERERIYPGWVEEKG